MPAAGHQVALSLASLSFSMAIGVGAATSVRVGRAARGSRSAPS
jgi:Na+-driven multidrug efflux pump